MHGSGLAAAGHAPGRVASARPLEVLGAALALGVLGEALLGEGPWGVGAPLWLGTAFLAIALLARRSGVRLRGDGPWLALPALGFAALIALRASPALLALDVLAIVVALGLASWRARDGRLWGPGVFAYLRGILATGVLTAVGPILLAVGEIRWRDVASSRGERITAVLRGVVLAAPVLVVFGTLLSEADPIFQRMISRIWLWEPEIWGEWLVLTLVWGWLAAGYLRQILVSRELPRLAPPTEPGWGIGVGTIEVTTVLGLVNLLFLLFVAVQSRYLFGGEELVQAAAGLSYAEYARRGFFELVAVAGLVAPLLLGAETLIRPSGSWESRRIRWLSGGLVALVLAIIASALHRMSLYQGAYGWTEERLYATAFIVWIAAVFLWYAGMGLRGGRGGFAFGAVVAGWAMVLMLNLLNPDALIARVNLERAHAGGRLDAPYLARLSPDATPTLLRALPVLPAEEACPIATTLAARAVEPTGLWTTWNWSRARARDAVTPLADELETLRRRSCGR